MTTAVAATPVAHADVLEPLPSDIRAARLADLGAVAGFAGLVTLVLMFAIEVPAGGPFRFGAANDLLGAAFSALFIPVTWRVARSLPDRGGMRALTLAAQGAAAAGAVLPVLLVSGTLPFEIETPLVVACIELQSLWLVAAGRHWRRRSASARFGRLSQAVGASFLAGSALFGVGFLAPDGPIRWTMWASGAIAGIVGYVGWPWWYHAAGRVLRGA